MSKDIDQTMHKPRRKTKLPDRFKPIDKGSKTSKKRLKEIQDAYPNIDLEIEQKPKKTLSEPVVTDRLTSGIPHALLSTVTR